MLRLSAQEESELEVPSPIGDATPPGNPRHGSAQSLPPSQELLGVRIQPLSMEDLNRAVRKALAGDHRLVIGNHNAHSVYLYHRTPEIRQFFDEVADLIHVDGMSLILAARILRLPFRRCHRTTYIDWIQPLMELAAELGAKVYHLGGQEGIGERARLALLARIPDLELATHHGFFDHRRDSDENRKVLEEINEYSPDILLVGMGMPRQERWIAECHDALSAQVILPCGACMDYLAGAVPTPPRWLSRAGFEWLARLKAEPRRLWKRYLLESWFLAALLGRDLVRRVVRR